MALHIFSDWPFGLLAEWDWRNTHLTRRIVTYILEVVSYLSFTYVSTDKPIHMSPQVWFRYTALLPLQNKWLKTQTYISLIFEYYNFDIRSEIVVSIHRVLVNHLLTTSNNPKIDWHIVLKPAINTCSSVCTNQSKTHENFMSWISLSIISREKSNVQNKYLVMAFQMLNKCLFINIHMVLLFICHLSLFPNIMYARELGREESSVFPFH